MAKTDFENLRVYKLSEKLADEVWDTTKKWGKFEKETVGKQLTRSADVIGADVIGADVIVANIIVANIIGANIIGANIAEGTGRGSFQDDRPFVRIARDSPYETKHWLRRAFRRGFLSQVEIESPKAMLGELAPMLNAYLNSIRKTESKQRTTDNGPRTLK